MRGAVVRMLITIIGAALMLAGGVILLTRRTIPIGPGGDVYIGYASDGVPFPAMPVAAALLIVGFALVVTMAVVGAVLARRGPVTR